MSLSAGDDGIHAESSIEINGGTIDIKKSYEGIEAAKITINGGNIAVASSDDGFNAAGGNDSSSPNMQRYRASSPDYAIVINGARRRARLKRLTRCEWWFCRSGWAIEQCQRRT